jgi:hypothetical protein
MIDVTFRKRKETARMKKSRIFRWRTTARAGLLMMAAVLASATASCGMGSSGSVGTGGAYSQSGGAAVKTGGTWSTSTADASAVFVEKSGTLDMSGATITKSGDSSNPDSSSFQGLNAAVLAIGGSDISLEDSTINATGIGANGAFAYGTGSSLTLTDVTIEAHARLAHAVMTAGGGSVTCTGVNMNTSSPNSGAIATDRGGGTITVTGGRVTTSGADAPGIYSTGTISVTSADISASGSEAAAIEGANSITLTDTSLASSYEGKWGVFIYQSMSGDAEGNRGTFNMDGGTLALTAASGPLLYVTNTTGVITLKGVGVTCNSGVLLKAAADRWGTSGSNGGHAELTADSQALAGDLMADASSTIQLTLANGSSLTGCINGSGSAKSVSLALDASSTWSVTADSHLTSLSGAGISGATVTNITGNGHTVYYDSASCPALGGLTYTLAGGGTLMPG